MHTCCLRGNLKISECFDKGYQLGTQANNFFPKNEVNVGMGNISPIQRMQTR